MSKQRFPTPRDDHYVEVLSSHILETNDGSDYKVAGFDEIRIVRGADRWFWRVNAVTNVELAGTGNFYPTSMAVGRKLDAGHVLGSAGTLEFKFHVSTPLSPLEKGIGVILLLEYTKDKGLQYKKTIWRSGSLWVYAGGWVERTAMPNWMTAPGEDWVSEDGGDRRAPVRGNRLLSADRLDRTALRTNLLHIDPSLVGAGAGDYSFSFAPVKGQDGWEICTAFSMARDFGFSAGVSDYALNLNVAVRGGTPMAARGLRLVCTMKTARNGWNLEWLGLAGANEGRPADTLTLESLSQALLTTHALGLATTRSRNRLSLIPTWLRTADATGTVKLKFSLAGPNLVLEDVRLRSIRLGHSDQTIQICCGGAQGTTGDAWVFEARAREGTGPDRPGTFLSWMFHKGDKPAKHRIGAGSVLLDVAQLEEGTLVLGLSPEGGLYRRAPLESNLRLTFNEASYSALSMEPELGFETLSSVVTRPRPWTIDLRDQTALDQQKCRLVIEESAKHDQSRMLRMELKLKQQADVTTDVALVDSSPMTVVRVQSSATIQGDEILAEYVDDADQAPEWRFFSGTGTIIATLPPQGIGEEMIKGWMFRKRGNQRVAVPAKGELFDFRLTPAARLILDTTDVDTARAEAPWSLRRLMSRRLGAIGMRLEEVRFELLYGMGARVQAENLRVAELDGFVGRVPFPDGLKRAYLRERDGQKGLEESYAVSAANWVAGLWNRPSWWRVYTDIAQRNRLMLDQGVEFNLRPTRETADPFAIEEYASRAGAPLSAPESREPLRGGVDWPFQSRSIYEELKRKPVSSSGSVEGLAFGPLGGEGSQTAAFNNGKTLIITNSRQGRLDAITLIRVGRIAMTWNKARHVIVYERTTRRAPRYDGGDEAPADLLNDLEHQPAVAGVAALRKVREYVEITEPRRRYPDIVANRPIGGPLQQSAFSTTTIPVKSTWGRDVKDGFAITLRGPIPPGQDALFPDPQVFFGLARAPGKGEGLVSQRITSTHKLVFFTSTRDEDGGDTDQWPAWPDIDFPLLAPPKPPKLPYNSSFSNISRQPDAAATELGMDRFTFSLQPSEEAVNLMHGRQEPGLEARIYNFNIARGLPERQDSVVQGAGDVFADANSRFVDGLRELAGALRERVANGDDRLLSELPALQAGVSALLGSLRVASGELGQVSIPGGDMLKEFGWASEQKKRGADYLAGVQKEAAGLGEQLRQQAFALKGGLDVTRAQACVAVDAVAQQAKRKVGEAGFVAELALYSATELAGELERRFKAHLEGTASRLLRDLKTIELAVAKGDMDLALLDRQWRASAGQIGADVRQVADILEPALNGGLGTWFSRLKSGAKNTLYAEFQEGVADQLPAVAEWLDRWIDNLPPFDLQAPDFTQLRRFLDDLLSDAIAKALLQNVDKFLQDLLAELGEWDKAIKDGLLELDEWALAMHGQFAAATGLQHLQKLVADAAGPLAAKLKDVAESVRDSLSDQIGKLPFAGLEGSLDALGDYPAKAKQFVDDLTAKLDGTVGDIERQLRETVGDVEAYAQASGRQIEEWARQELGEAMVIAKSGVGAGLEAVRILAEGPVTDAMRVTREQVGYYYDKALDALDVTRASVVFNDLGEDVLNALSARLPFDRIRERLLPMLDNCAVCDLFPDFCGIKLTYLLPDLDVSIDGSHEYGWLQFQHGFDKERLSAWAKVSIDKRFEDDGTLFDLGPIKMRLLKPRFTAMADIIIEKDGQRRQITAGKLEADFQLSLNDKPMVTLCEGSLSFDERGEIDFNFNAEKLVLADELQFVSDAVKALMPDMEGLTITPLLPAGVNAELMLPLPDIGTGAFTLTGVTLNARLGLVVGNGFEIRTALWLSKPERPFGMAVLFLGGGGWFGIEANYKPPSRFVTRVSIGLSAGAFVAINFGFAHGSAGILFTASVDFYRDWSTGSGTTAISLGLLVWGEFSVLGIASASLRLTLTITYIDGGMVGTGTLSLRIRICWCYTLHVSRSVQQVFAKPSGSSGISGSTSSAKSIAAQPAAGLITGPAGANAAAAGLAKKVEKPLAADYGTLPAAKPTEAVSDYFDTLAI